jgi:hypothetical protein
LLSLIYKMSELSSNRKNMFIQHTVGNKGNNLFDRTYDLSFTFDKYLLLYITIDLQIQ